MAEDKKKPEDDNPFSEEMPSVTRLLNRKSLKTGQINTPAAPAPAKPAAPAPIKSAAAPAKPVTSTGIKSPPSKPPAPPPLKKPPPGGSGTKK